MAELTDEQMALIKDAFALFDKNGDGYVSTKELGEVMRTLGQNPTEPELQNIINDVDVDHTKTIDFEEFCVLMATKMKETVCEAEVEQAYRAFGKDKNGLIPASELRFVLLNIGENVTGQEVEEMIQAADTDGDGFISYDEFIPMIMPGLVKVKAAEAAAQAAAAVAAAAEEKEEKEKAEASKTTPAKKK